MAIKGNKKKWKKVNGKWYKKEASTKPIRFIPCSEDSQVFSWQRTNKKATENFRSGPTGAVWKKPRGKVHDYLTRNDNEKEKKDNNNNDDTRGLSFMKEIAY